MVSLNGRAVFAILAGALIFTPGASRLAAQQPKQDERAERQQQERLQRARSQEIQPLVKQLDSLMATAGAAPAEFPAMFQADFLKASDEKTYVPFTVSIPKDGVTSNAVAVYIRVAPKGATGPAAPPEGERDPKAAPPPRYPFEDLHFIDLKQTGPSGEYRFSRAFAVPSGDYDVYIAMKERNKKEGAKTTILKQEVAVPDFWGAELTTSSLILTERMDPLTQPLSRDQQIERPYALGSVEVVPAEDSTLSKTEVLSLFFLIYNPQLGADNKPNVLVDYSFYQKTDGAADKYFNRTPPQEFSAQTLPPEFDLAAGHQLVAGQSVPLQSFPEGEYRLEIKITDRMSGKTVTRNVTFKVVPA